MSYKKISSISTGWQRIQEQEQKYLAELWKNKEYPLQRKAVEKRIGTYTVPVLCWVFYIFSIILR